MPEDEHQVSILSSSKHGLRFQKTHFFNWPTQHKINDHYDYKNKIYELLDKSAVFVTRNVDSYYHTNVYKAIVHIHRLTEPEQKIIGFGGAFTGAVSYNLRKLPQNLVDMVYNSYYSKEYGIGFNMMRIPIGGCDFDLAPWAYNEEPHNDKKLSNFYKLDQRDVEKVEQIKRLMEITDNNQIKFVGAAWSPPPWMKTNEDWSGLGYLKHEFYQTWADYHVRFLQLMNEVGLKFWAISTGNEPLNGTPLGALFIKFMSLGWKSEDQGEWIAKHLGPTMKNSKNVSDVKILAGDGQRLNIPYYFNHMYVTNTDAYDYVYGHALHWYWDSRTIPQHLDVTQLVYEDKPIIITESSVGDIPL